MDNPGGSSRVDEKRPRPQGAAQAGGGFGAAPRGDSRFAEVGEDEAGGERSRRYSQISERNRCRFCRDKVERVDYKDVLTLQKLCTSQGRIFSRKRSGNCAAHQRMVKNAIKQARYIGLMSYTA